MELDPSHPKHPEDWASLDPPVCIWCRGGEEHHGVGRRQRAFIERQNIILMRLSIEVAAYISPSLMAEVNALLDAEEVT